jgi:16S rRNA processing protein RimM
MRIALDFADSVSLTDVGRVFLERGGESTEFKLESTSPLGKGTRRIILAGISDATQADAWKGASVMLAESDMPPVEPGQFYYEHLIGCRVVTDAGAPIGEVAETFSNGANDIIVVRDGAREVMIPVIADIVKEIDIEGKLITITPIPGLLD